MRQMHRAGTRGGGGWETTYAADTCLVCPPLNSYLDFGANPGLTLELEVHNRNQSPYARVDSVWLASCT